MKASEFISNYTIDPKKDIQSRCSRTLTKVIDASSNFRCVNCDNNTLVSYPSEPWTSVLYCPYCKCINVIYHSDRMSGVNTDTVECYK